jgi:AmmeMemoRadiSam system protein B
MKKTREPVVAGLFYPEGSVELRALVGQLFEKADTPSGSAFALISPHAAFEKAGLCCAHAFKAASARTIRRVFLLGPVHREPEDALFLPESSYFRTPLGECEVDVSAVDTLLSCSTRFLVNDIPHLEEHCLEVQLPFIQVLFPDASIVPILVGKPSRANTRLLSQAVHVAQAGRGAETLVVATANLHARNAGAALRMIERGEWEELAESRGEYMCGAACAAAVMSLAEVKGGIRLLHHHVPLATERDHVPVEYAAFSLFEV